MNPTIDTIKAIFTYGIATIIVVGGGAMLYSFANDPNTQNTALVIAGFIGAAIQFVFNQETQTRTARQATAASVSGATLHANGIQSSEGKAP